MVGHLLVDAVFHAQRVVQRGVEGLVHVGRGGLDGAVQIQVAYAFGGEQYALHNVFVVHGFSLLKSGCKTG